MAFPFISLEPANLGDITFFSSLDDAKAVAARFEPEGDEGHSIDIVPSGLGWMVRWTDHWGDRDVLYYSSTFAG